jgi:hypothetical protein
VKKKITTDLSNVNAGYAAKTSFVDGGGVGYGYVNQKGEIYETRYQPMDSANLEAFKAAGGGTKGADFDVANGRPDLVIGGISISTPERSEKNGFNY